MKVKELIKLLHNMDQESEVYAECHLCHSKTFMKSVKAKRNNIMRWGPYFRKIEYDICLKI